VATMRRLCLGLATVAVLAMQVPASARPFTETEAGKWSETLTNEEWACTDEHYDVVTTGHQITHITVETDEQGFWVYPLHFTNITWGKQIATPTDGTGPSYVGFFRASDSENIRAVKQGRVFVETDIDLGAFIAKGSDGSRIRQHQHAHFTFNANGDVTVRFETDRATCIAGRG
jgi:hypothetical protein